MNYNIIKSSFHAPPPNSIGIEHRDDPIIIKDFQLALDKIQRTSSNLFSHVLSHRL